LWEQLPKVASVFAEGRVDYRVVSTIVSRSSLVTDDADMERLDKVLAARVSQWNKLSDKKLTDMIDGWVVHVDTLAKKPARKADDARDIGIEPDRHGMAEVRGILRAADALAFDARLDQLADTVCAHDPRTKAQRRADATGAVAAGHVKLACQCGRDECPVPGNEPATRDVVIHVLAPAETVQGDSDTPGFVPGFGFLDSESIREVAQSAKLRPLRHPGDSPAETGYRPSVALADFVRFRDMTCRFPGCDAAAEVCDIDHTLPWPFGPTHASNLKLLCRRHHLLKTFWTGWWRDKQMPDGRVMWTSPTGHTYTTKPDGALFFPDFAKPTGNLVLPNDIPPPTSGRGVMMPTRKRTRAQERQARIEYERGLNAKLMALDPPPF
jgi:hypothetical protein